jgi:hypothetical protein
MADADADDDDDGGVYARVEVNQRALIDKVRSMVTGGTRHPPPFFPFVFRYLLFFRENKTKQAHHLVN